LNAGKVLTGRAGEGGAEHLFQIGEGGLHRAAVLFQRRDGHLGIDPAFRSFGARCICRRTGAGQGRIERRYAALSKAEGRIDLRARLRRGGAQSQVWRGGFSQQSFGLGLYRAGVERGIFSRLCTAGK
jgi:hypothetical protein